MPIHFRDLDVVSEVAGVGSALIVPCNMCPAVTVAAREKQPFMRFFRHFLKSAPFEQYIRTLRYRLSDAGVKTGVFRNFPGPHWFMCMSTSGKRKKLRKRAKDYDAVIVLGCESATRTVRDAVESSGCKVIEGMAIAGIMNAQLKFHFPDRVTFENCSIVPIEGSRGG